MQPTTFDLIIKGATVLANSPKGEIEEVKIDIGIQFGKIAALGNLAHAEGRSILPAFGLHVLPGIIDSQVHFREPGLEQKEDFETGTKGALLGGVTGVFEMPNTKPATTTGEAINDKVQRTAGRLYSNIGFYLGATLENADQLSDWENLPGCVGIKIFMGSSTGSLLVDDESTLLKVLSKTRRRVAIHAEDEARLIERKPIATNGAHPRFHPEWRDPESALIATKRIIGLAKQARRSVHILHVSTAQEMEFLAANKNFCTVEVTPQHLTLFAPDCYERLGNFAQMNPPIRERKHLESLWMALQRGVVDVIGSDHAPHTIEEKKRPYPESPSGMTGVQTLVPIMLDHVADGRLSLKHFVKLASQNPAHLFGLQNKGQIRIGADADLTIVDLKKEMRIENKWIASRCAWTPFDGVKVRGWVEATVVNGQLAMLGGDCLGKFGQVYQFRKPE